MPDKLPFFLNIEHVGRLRSEALSWVGTPYLEACGARARPGICADCTWIAQPLQRVGAIGAVDWPERYVSHGGGPRMLELLQEVLARVPRLERIWRRPLEPLPPLLPGDVLLYSTGIRLHHLGLFVGDNTLLHSWYGRVDIANVEDQREKLLRSIYRAMSQ